MNNKWVSLHIFDHDMRNYDPFILSIYEKMTDYKNSGLVQKWFFIRYWEGGPHLRLRFITEQQDLLIGQIENHVRLYWANTPDEKPLTKANYYQNHQFDGETISMEELPWYDHRSVQNIPYLPEILRYGGKEVMSHSESIFMQSSELICCLLKTLKPDLAKKFIAGLAMTRILIEELLEFEDMEDNKQFTIFYKKYWESFAAGNETNDVMELFTANENSISKFYNALNNNGTVKTYIQRMKKELAQVREAVDDELYIHRIAASHIHMTNNRFGISPFIEYCISDYLSQHFTSDKSGIGGAVLENPAGI
ncbi:thiopeptide-type bacteriocin biosynthesis protein [Cytobacillus gottheilii]|uniref:thiopeptide-type bacteriocin biosynthesis protein n=1 Tax=Cytobacillus gottheilii TaxID=859144 RepID=UPI003CF6EAFE